MPSLSSLTNLHWLLIAEKNIFDAIAYNWEKYFPQQPFTDTDWPISPEFASSLQNHINTLLKFKIWSIGSKKSNIFILNLKLYFFILLLFFLLLHCFNLSKIYLPFVALKASEICRSFKELIFCCCNSLFTSSLIVFSYHLENLAKKEIYSH